MYGLTHMNRKKETLNKAMGIKLEKDKESK